MRKLALLLTLVALAPCAAKAQDGIQLFGGYSYFRFHFGSQPVNLNGWNIAGTYKPDAWFGLTADFSGQYGSPSGTSTSTHSYLFGPQVSLPGPISPFVHFLAGASHEAIGGFTDTSFATAVGGGVDTKIIPLVSLRLIELDYLETRFGGTSQNNLRISTGITLNF